MDELRQDVGKDSNEGIRGKLEDHIRTCGTRWETLSLEMEKLRGALGGLERSIKSSVRTVLIIGGLVAFIVTTGITVMTFIIDHGLTLLLDHLHH